MSKIELASAVKGKNNIRTHGALSRCFLTTDSFSSAILQAANLGDDADTTGAVCGQIAGAYYGESGIPSHWLERLAMGDGIGTIAEQLYAGRALAS